MTHVSKVAPLSSKIRAVSHHKLVFPNNLPITFTGVNCMSLFLYEVCPKSNEIFFCAAQKGQGRKVGVEAGGEGTQVYSLTFLS